jgi:hypothetical protein
MCKTSPLTGDELHLSPVKLTAAQATRHRLRVSRDGWAMPVSRYEHDLYVIEGLEPPEGATADMPAPRRCSPKCAADATELPFRKGCARDGRKR